MKVFFIIALLLLNLVQVFSQKPEEIYKQELIDLDQQEDFGAYVNWRELFYYYPGKKDTSLISDLDKRKKIVIAPDGSIFMSHKNIHEIWKFDKDGNLIKKFGSKGSKPGQFIYLPNVEGILDDKYLITSDNQGRLNIFDLNGNFIKLLKIDYMPLAIAPLKNGKMAILGHVSWSNSQARTLLRIIDFNTGIEKEIFNKANTNVVAMNIKFPHGGGMSNSISYAHPMAWRIRISSSKEKNLITASPETGEVIEYDPYGKLLNSFKLTITPLQITDQDINDQYEQALKKSETFEKSVVRKIAESDSVIRKRKWTEKEIQEVIESYKKQVENFRDRKFYPQLLPYFSSMVIDSDGNLLFFQYTKDYNPTGNKFSAYAYDMKGRFIGTSSFRNDYFDISYTPSTFQFYNGFVYAVAGKKNNVDIMEIVKMKVEE